MTDTGSGRQGEDMTRSHSLPAWLAEETETVPDLSAFLGAQGLEDALNELGEAPGARLHRIGTSRLGSPISCLSVGEGTRDAVVFGLPHPNEPVGGLTTLHLARRLVEEADLRGRLGHRWHLVACIDPDGLRLNEGWLAGPFTRSHYRRHFYRPAGDEQVEWTFPISYKRAYFDRVLPETLALMRLIDDVRPSLMGSLHNSEQGGAYFYVSRSEPDLDLILQAIPPAHGIPLDRGEPESPTSTRFGDGIFSALSLRQMYDAAEKDGDPLPLGAGDTSDSYAARYGTYTLVSEVPYWSDPRVADDSLSDRGYGAALADQASELERLGRLLVETLVSVEPHLSTNSPFLRATRYFAPFLAADQTATRRRAAEPAAQRPATVAEAASIDDLVHSFRLRYGGMLLRMLEAEAAVGNVRPDLLIARDLTHEHLEAWHAEAAAADHAVTLPIRALVATQYGALLAAADHLRR